MQFTIKEKSLLIGLLEKEIIRMNEKESKYKEMLNDPNNSNVHFLVRDNLKAVDTRRKHCFNALHKIEGEININE